MIFVIMTFKHIQNDNIQAGLSQVIILVPKLIYQNIPKFLYNLFVRRYLQINN